MSIQETDSRVSILHVTGALSGGGAERQLHLLLKSYPEAKHTVFALNAKEGESYEGLAVSVHRRESKTGWKELVHLMKELEPDILHCWIPATLPYALPAAYIYGKKKVKVVAGMRSAYRFDHWQRRMQHTLYRLTDRIVSNVHPDNMKSAYRKVYKKKQGRFIPNGLDFTQLLSSPATKPAPDIRQPFILYAGRLIPDKNLGRLLESIADLPEAQLVVCGAGEEGENLLALCERLKIGGRVFFAGYRTDVYAIMKAAKVFVLPSLREGMPNVAFEALAAGCRLVLSDLPVHRYWFDRYAGSRLFATENVTALTTALRESLHDQNELPDARKLLDKVTPAALAANYRDYYLEVLTSQSSTNNNKA